MASMKAYRKAYYKLSARNKLEIKTENLNSRIAKFLFQKYSEEYVEMFGDTIDPLMGNETLDGKPPLGVIRYGNNIVGVFALDGKGKFLGDLEGLPLSRKDIELLERYNVRWSCGV